MCRGAEDERSVMSLRAGMIPTAESEECSDKLQRAEACLPASDLSPFPFTLICISVYLCDSKPPAGGAGGGRAVWAVSPHATEEQRGEDDQARGRGAGGGEDKLDISFSLSLFLLPIFFGSIFGIK